MSTYVDNAYATAYFADHRLIAYAWTDSTAEKQDIAIQMATDALERLNYDGSKTDAEQDLQFPRDGDTEIPVAMKQACCECAYAFIDGYDQEYEMDNVRATSLKFANVVTKYDSRVVPYHKIEGIPSIKAWQLIQPFLRDTKSMELIRSS